MRRITWFRTRAFSDSLLHTVKVFGVHNWSKSTKIFTCRQCKNSTLATLFFTVCHLTLRELKNFVPVAVGHEVGRVVKNEKMDTCTFACVGVFGQRVGSQLVQKH